MIAIKETIVKKIEQYENIAIFFHELPDLDALGSAYGLQYFLKTKYPGKEVKIIGLGTTGSGRNIVGIHALTESIYNEIICHATASVHFDKDVDKELVINIVLATSSRFGS